MYCSTSEVYGASGLTTSEVSESNVENFILEAMSRVDRLTNTTYWAVNDYGTFDSATSAMLIDNDKYWDTNEYSENDFVWIYSGTGSGQARKILSNSLTALTVDSDFTTLPSNDSKYRVVTPGNDALIINELRDGNDTDTFFADKYPVRIIQEVITNSVTVTPSYIYNYKSSGRLVLGTSAEATTWTSKKAQYNNLTYWYGVYPLPYEIKRLTILYASVACLQSQMGTTHNIPSTYSLPEGSVTVGQAYINIEGTVRRLLDEQRELERIVVRYTSFA